MRLSCDQIKSPIILITPEGEYIYFENGTALLAEPLDYEIDTVKAFRDEIEIRVKNRSEKLK